MDDFNPHAFTIEANARRNSSRRSQRAEPLAVRRAREEYKREARAKEDVDRKESSAKAEATRIAEVFAAKYGVIVEHLRTITPEDFARLMTGDK